MDVKLSIMVNTPKSNNQSGKSSEEIISQLGEQFVIALYRSDEATAKKICNKTGFETFQALGAVVSLGTLGYNQKIDETFLAGKIDTIDVKMLSDSKGIARVMANLDNDPQFLNIPVEKDENGEWKVAVTKQNFG